MSERDKGRKTEKERKREKERERDKRKGEGEIMSSKPFTDERE
jgi:hypothetical protein